MRVILLENLRNFGSIGDIVNVKRGFARNYLIAQKKALFASKKNIENVEKIKKDLNKKDVEKKKSAKDIADKLDKRTFDVRKLCTENKELYGSVKPTEISKLIKEQANIDINSSLIQPIKEIRSIGKFKILINLHSEIQTNIYINVISDEKNN
tara:strand:- start:309 stop:767 length:459 start_codon:yes stop_codon:yes gene_type:complete